MFAGGQKVSAAQKAYQEQYRYQTPSSPAPEYVPAAPPRSDSRSPPAPPSHSQPEPRPPRDEPKTKPKKRNAVTSFFETVLEITLLIVGFLLSAIGPFAFLTACLLSPVLNKAYMLGAGIGMFLEGLACVLAFLFVPIARWYCSIYYDAVSNIIDSNTGKPISADQRVKDLADCEAQSNLIKYVVLGSGLLWIMLALIAFIVSALSGRKARREQLREQQDAA
ncbi:hypothetical protein BJ742DRAFT_768888 [Cladochytrium replicatum]|nr:hypothetical protein BJ742DRAFT_768888 [Cladochytrium replicatum]